MSSDTTPTVRLDNGEELHRSGLANLLEAIGAIPVGVARRTGIPVTEYPGDRRSNHPLPRPRNTSKVSQTGGVVVSVEFGSQRS